jgi:hypothetical protein
MKLQVVKLKMSALSLDTENKYSVDLKMVHIIAALNEL